MKTLIIGLNWVGDVVMSFPAIAGVAVGLGDKVDILTRPHLEPLYRLHPGVDCIWSVPSKRPFWYFLGALRNIRARRYARILVLPTSVRAAWLAFLCGGRQRIGFATQRRNLLLTKAVPLPEYHETWHESHLWEHLTSACGVPERHVPLPSIAPEKLPTLAQLRQRCALPDGQYGVLAPGAAFGPAKQWPLSRFQELATAIIAQFGFPVVITGGEGEKELTARLGRSLGAWAVDLGGLTSLPELIAVLGGARFVVANDSGTMHLAALAKAPIIVPVGPTDPRRTGPLSPDVAIVTGSSRCPQQPCRKPSCTMPGHPCMTSITGEMVMTALKDLLLRMERQP